MTSASAGSIFGNFSGSTAAPSYNLPGSTDQLLGVKHSGSGGLEYKSIVAGPNITVTNADNLITISATANLVNPMTTVGDMIYGASSGTATRLAGNATTAKQFLVQTGTGSASAAPTWGNITSADLPPITAANLPATTVNSVSNLPPVFTASIASQNLSFALSNSNSGTLFGNFSGASAAPSYNAPGSNDQILGVSHSSSGLEWKTITGGTNITVSLAAGSITISAPTLLVNPMTTLGDILYEGSSSPQRLAGSTSTAKRFLTQTGTGTASNAPAWGALASTDLPSNVVTASGNLLPLFTSSISSQTLNFTPSNVSGGTIFGNFGSASAAPTFNNPGSANQILGISNGGNSLEYKTIAAGTNITISNTAGVITINSTGSSTVSFINQCRLYGVSGAPYQDTSPPNVGGTLTAGATSIILGPCPNRGNIISIPSGSSFTNLTMTSEVSLSLSTLTAAIYDIFAYNNSGTVALEADLPPSDTTTPRLQIVNGVYCKASDATRLYLGTIEVASVTIGGTTQNVVYSCPGYRGIWNLYNRTQCAISALDTTSSWTAGSSVWRTANAKTNTVLNYGIAIARVITGLPLEPVSVTRFVRVAPGSYNYAALFGLGFTSTQPEVAGEVFATSYTNGGLVSSAIPFNNVQTPTSSNQPAGVSYFNLENAAEGTYYGMSGTAPNNVYYSGMYGTTWC